MGQIDRRVGALAARQHGVITRAQVVELGGDRDMPSRRVAAGRWRRAATGVFVVNGAPDSFPQRVLVAVLAAGSGALASHRTAAALWGFTSEPDRIEVTIPADRVHRGAGVTVHRSSDVAIAAPIRLEGIPVTGAARTLLDLGAVAPATVRRAVWAALRQRATAWDVLLRTLTAHARPGRRGVAALRAVVAEHYGERATDSTTEDVAYEVLVDSGLVPRPEKQVRVVCADGVTVTVDVGWPRYRALLEVFGVDHLTNEDLAHTDLHRRNQIELAGYRLLVYSGRMLSARPDQFLLDVDRMLREAGWDGTL